MEAGEVDLRPAFFHLGRGELLKLDMGLAKDFERATLVGVIVAADHPEDAGAVEELGLPVLLVLRPQLEGAAGQFGVGLVRPVGATHDAGFAARGGARVAWAPSVQ